MGAISNHVHLATTTFLCAGNARTEEYRAANIPMLPVVKGFARTKKSMLGWVSIIIPTTVSSYRTWDWLSRFSNCTEYWLALLSD